MGTHLRKIFHDVISLEPDTNSSVERIGSQTIFVYIHRSTDRLSYRYQEIVGLSEEQMTLSFTLNRNLNY